MVNNRVANTKEDFDISHVKGNASDKIKHFLGNPQTFYASFSKPGQRRLNGFGQEIEDRLKITELSILRKPEEPSKIEGRAVIELDVIENMVNGAGNLHGGCTAFLVDIASMFAITALNLHLRNSVHPSVSQAINVVYHSPATIGDRLRLVNTTMAVGKRTDSIRTEIWNDTHHRLVATGIHIKMAASPAPKASL